MVYTLQLVTLPESDGLRLSAAIPYKGELRNGAHHQRSVVCSYESFEDFNGILQGLDLDAGELLRVARAVKAAQEQPTIFQRVESLDLDNRQLDLLGLSLIALVPGPSATFPRAPRQ